MSINLFIVLSSVSIIPILVTMLLPKEKSFFEKGIVRGFGLGVYMMLVLVLFRESIEITGIWKTLIWLGAGLLFSVFLGLIFKEFHHHHSKDEKIHRHNQASTMRILISDFLHNIVDGIAIISGMLINPLVGITSYLGVLGHQIIQQTGQQILLVENGIKARKAIFISFMISLSIFLGFLFKNGGVLEAIFMAISAGIIAWKVGTDLLHSEWNKKMILGFMCGGLILAGILVAIPHAHEEDHGEEIPGLIEEYHLD